jgi:hypothetical protein
VEFALDLEDIVIPTHCPVLGIKLDTRQINGYDRDNSPSLDRIFPDQGYVKGNVKIISWRANSLKKNATPQELIALGKWMEKYGKEVEKA